MSVLIFKQADHGTLTEFMNSTVVFAQRLQLCRDIERVIDAMHELSKR